ncbi:MAG: LPS export ABC transporter permease LptG [Alphaproteobacteria bacterium]|nr:LPS export ABC transporter permease LptG [Alphaproteobacteria bacterium]
MWNWATLEFYLARRFLVAILATFVLCAGLIFMIDFVELLRQSGKTGNVPLFTLVGLTLLRLPAYTEFLLPFAILVGSIATLLWLSRKSELAVMRAGGMSAWQYLRPGLVVAFALGVFAVAIYNPLAATARAYSEQLAADAFGRDAKLFRSDAEGVWLRQNGTDGESVISALYPEKDGINLRLVTAFIFDKMGAFSARIDAERAILKNGYWELQKAVVGAVDQPPNEVGVYLLPTHLTPERVRDTLGNVISVSFWQLPNLIEHAEKARISSHRLRVQYELLLSRPLLCLAMVLLAATVSLRSFRSGGIQTMVITGMIGGFGFFLMAEVSRQIGNAGLAPPWAAVWIPTLAVILVTTTVLLHQEDG